MENENAQQEPQAEVAAPAVEQQAPAQQEAAEPVAAE